MLRSSGLSTTNPPEECGNTNRQEKNRQAQFAQQLPKDKGSNSARRHCYRLEHWNKTLLNRRTLL